MKYFKNQFYALSKNCFAHYGFRRNKQAFIRVVNDVAQSFHLETICSGSACRVQFAILPLCMGLDLNTTSGEVWSPCGGSFSFNLRRMADGCGPGDWDSWRLYPHSTEVADACIQDISYYFRTYLLPIFLQVDTCEKAISAYSVLEERCFITWWNMHIRAVDYQREMDMIADMVISNSSVFFAALKNKDYETALRSREALLKRNEIACRSNWDGYSDAAKSRCLKNLELLCNDINRLREKDYVYFQARIEENETQSRNRLNKYIID